MEIDRQGKLNIFPGKMVVGEDLDVESLRMCISRAIAGEPPESFLLLRDGDISEKEMHIFETLMFI